MAKFVYNNIKNTNTGYTLFKLNYRYFLYISYKKDFNPWSQSKTANKLLAKFQKLMLVCYNNLFHAQKL